MRFSRFGVNAVFHEPLDRPAALKLVRATQMLVLHEFRRYVRIPIITEISIVTDDSRRFTATSKEISTGGLSVKSPGGCFAGYQSGSVVRAADAAADLGPRECQLAKAKQDIWSALRRQGRTPIPNQRMD